MIDCSGFPEFALAKQNVCTTQITHLILTHGHIDHIYAIPSLLHNIHAHRMPIGGGLINIFGLDSTLDTTDKLINVFKIREKTNPLDIRLHPLADTEGIIPVTIAGVKIEYFTVEHGTTPTIGLSISRKDTHILFSSDTVVCQAVLQRIKPNTILIHDCGSGLHEEKMHASAYNLADKLSLKKWKHLYLCHLPHLNTDDLQTIADIFAENKCQNISIPKDNDCFEIKSGENKP